MSRRSFIIVNRETGKEFLLPVKDFFKKGMPKGYVKRTSIIPISEELWKEAKHLPLYEWE